MWYHVAEIGVFFLRFVFPLPLEREVGRDFLYLPSPLVPVCRSLGVGRGEGGACPELVESERGKWPQPSVLPSPLEGEGGGEGENRLPHFNKGGVWGDFRKLITDY